MMLRFWKRDRGCSCGGQAYRDAVRDAILEYDQFPFGSGDRDVQYLIDLEHEFATDPDRCDEAAELRATYESRVSDLEEALSDLIEANDSLSESLEGLLGSPVSWAENVLEEARRVLNDGAEEPDDV